MPDAKKKIIVLGCGFAGLSFVKACKGLGDSADILVVDKQNHHLFQPLLYQVAMAGLSAPEVSEPIRVDLPQAAGGADGDGHGRVGGPGETRGDAGHRRGGAVRLPRLRAGRDDLVLRERRMGGGRAGAQVAGRRDAGPPGRADQF